MQIRIILQASLTQIRIISTIYNNECIYSIKHNFITMNSYCIAIQMYIIVILKLRCPYNYYVHYMIRFTGIIL